MSEAALSHVSRLAATEATQFARYQNHAIFFAGDAMKSETARVDAQFVDDFVPVLAGNCIYLKQFMTNESDLVVLRGLEDDLARSSRSSATIDARTEAQPLPKSAVRAVGTAERDAEAIATSLRDWSKHQMFENPQGISPTFNAVVDYIERYFDLDVYATRLNYYRDGQAWKPFHHDSHAYGGRAQREDFTVGLSLGAKRELAFLHEPTKRQFVFPQRNGECFAFSNLVNERFMHGVPKSTNRNCGARISIIVWGKRRTLNERNGGPTTLPKHIASVLDGEVRRNPDGSYAKDTENDIVRAAKLLVAQPQGSRGVPAIDEPKPRAKKKNRLQ